MGKYAYLKYLLGFSGSISILNQGYFLYYNLLNTKKMTELRWIMSSILHFQLLSLLKTTIYFEQ